MHSKAKSDGRMLKQILQRKKHEKWKFKSSLMSMNAKQAMQRIKGQAAIVIQTKDTSPKLV